MCKVDKTNHNMWQTSEKSLQQLNHRCAVTKRYSNNNNVNIHTCSKVHTQREAEGRGRGRVCPSACTSVFVCFVCFSYHHPHMYSAMLTKLWMAKACDWILITFHCWFWFIYYIECFVIKMNLCFFLLSDAKSFNTLHGHRYRWLSRIIVMNSYYHNSKHQH